MTAFPVIKNTTRYENRKGTVNSITDYLYTNSWSCTETEVKMIKRWLQAWIMTKPGCKDQCCLEMLMKEQWRKRMRENKRDALLPVPEIRSFARLWRQIHQLISEWQNIYILTWQSNQPFNTNVTTQNVIVYVHCYNLKENKI